MLVPSLSWQIFSFWLKYKNGIAMEKRRFPHQSRTPLDITTAFFDVAPLPGVGGPRNTMISQPGY
eukprot:COSAG06_NODE_43871_length_368_cov_0.769517_1_plen_64_part_10